MADTESSKSWADIQDEEDRAAATATATATAPASDKATEEITEGLADATTQDPNAPLQIRLKTLSQDFFGEDEIEVFNSNPNSPLYSAKTFEELNLAEPLIKGVYALGFEKPSKIQEKALPLILSNPPQNLIAQAQSGTGKTAAFTLGMLSRVDISKKVPQAICVSPIRELARQIATNVEAMGKFLTGLEVGLAIPSDNKFERSRERLTSHVIIGTPGTLCSVLQQRTLDSRNIKVLVMDEADELLAGGNLREQTKRLQQLLPPSTQTLCFSATYHPEVFKVAESIVRGKNNRPYSKITLKVTELSLETVKQYYINVGDESKKYEVLSLIFGFIKVGGQTLIFVNTRAKAKELVTNLRKDNHTVNLLTAEMEPTERDAVIDEYRTGKTKILISTNVLARGIDILQIALVINYDVPVVQVPGKHKGEADAETYLHRCGRSARYGRPGVVINFVSDAKSLAIVKSLEALLKREIAEMKVEEIPDLEDVMKKIRKN